MKKNKFVDEIIDELFVDSISDNPELYSTIHSRVSKWTKNIKKTNKNIVNKKKKKDSRTREE